MATVHLSRFISNAPSSGRVNSLYFPYLLKYASIIPENATLVWLYVIIHSPVYFVRLWTTKKVSLTPTPPQAWHVVCVPFLLVKTTHCCSVCIYIQTHTYALNSNLNFTYPFLKIVTNSRLHVQCLVYAASQYSRLFLLQTSSSSQIPIPMPAHSRLSYLE